MEKESTWQVYFVEKSITSKENQTSVKEGGLKGKLQVHIHSGWFGEFYTPMLNFIHA